MDWDEEITPPRAAEELGVHRRTTARWAAKPGRVSGVSVSMEGLHLTYRATRRAWYEAAGKPLVEIPASDSVTDAVMDLVLSEESRIWRLEMREGGRVGLIEVAPTPEAIAKARPGGQIYKAVLRPNVLAKQLSRMAQPFATGANLLPVQLATSERGVERVKARPAIGHPFHRDLFPAAVAWGPVGGIEVAWDGALHLSQGWNASGEQLWNSLTASVIARRWVQRSAGAGVVEAVHMGGDGRLGTVFARWEDPACPVGEKHCRMRLRNPDEYRSEVERAVTNLQRCGYLLLRQPPVLVEEE